MTREHEEFTAAKRAIAVAKPHNGKQKLGVFTNCAQFAPLSPLFQTPRSEFEFSCWTAAYSVAPPVVAVAPETTERAM